MLRQIAGIWILITLSLGAAMAQSDPSAGRKLQSKITPASIAVTYNTELSKTTFSSCNCFWFQGASVDANWSVWHHLGLAAQFSGGHASNIGPGVDISKVNFFFGPRYTWQPAGLRHHKYHPAVFGEVLLGGVHVFNTVVPTTSGTTSSATSFGLQTGGGANLWLTRHFGLRVIQLDYVYSQIPNAGNSTQNDLRIATGVIWRLP